MKKQLLWVAALIAAPCLQAQQQLSKNTQQAFNLAGQLASKFGQAGLINELNAKPTQSAAPAPGHPAFPASKTSAAINWTKISSSMNIYGVLESSSKPLQYNDELNAVSFIHRKSLSYVPSPVPTSTNSASGVIVAMVSTNCGAGWDSTCIWNNNTQFARFPQGAIYNPPGNTNVGNAYIAASGPITNGTSWIGNYAASKKLDAPQGLGYNNIASTVTGAQQFFPNSPPYTAGTGKFDFPSFDFTATDDGIMRTLSSVVADFNATGSSRKYRGAKIIKGTFASGVFNWTADSLIIAPLTVSTSAGDAQLLGQPHMAWNDSGTVGYVVHIGCRLYSGTVAPQNTGFQPIVYKTTNGGQTWSLMQGIDFTQPVFTNKVLNHIQPIITNSNVVIPLFNLGEGLDVTVDKNDKLHIMATVIGTRHQVPDSLGFVYNFLNVDGDLYNYPHVPGMRPYLYDFYETGSGWNVHVIDSMSSEAPGIRSGEDGFNDNPWDATGGTNNNEKVSSDARLQMSRTPGGEFIVYSWAESDTNFTASGKKWNNIPNVKTRALSVNLNFISTNELLMTSGNNGISAHAQMHHTSPKSMLVGTGNLSVLTATLKVPMTVSNNQNVPLTQLLPNDHWYTCSEISFSFDIDAIGENNLNTIKASIFPNPADNVATLAFELNDNATLSISITNVLGKTESLINYQAEPGQNQINLPVQNLSKGIYFVNLRAGDKAQTVKLIIE